MRINTNNNAKIQNPLTGGAASQQASGSAGAQQAAETGFTQAADAVQEAYVRKAVANEGVDMQAVAEAKKLLDSGQLDTPDAIARAAENLVTKGI